MSRFELRFSVSESCSVALVWKRLLLLGMFWKVEFKPLSFDFWLVPFEVPILWELTSLPLTGVMMLL